MRKQIAMAASTDSLLLPRAASAGLETQGQLMLLWLLLVCSRKDFGLEWEGELNDKLPWLFPVRGQ